MRIRWGVLYEASPLSGGEKGGVQLDFLKTSSSKCLLRASFFNSVTQLKLKMASAAGHSLYTHG